jgi:hypothetical protein
VRHIWHRDDGLGACFIMEAADLTTARTVIESLPIAAAGLAEFVVLPLRPYRGFTN